MLWSRVRLRWLVGAVAGVLLLASAVVITGIRPEQFEDAAGRPDAGVDIGTETEIVARLDAGTRAREGERLTIRFDPAAVAVFDPRTGDRLYAGGNVPGRS